MEKKTFIAKYMGKSPITFGKQKWEELAELMMADLEKVIEKAVSEGTDSDKAIKEELDKYVITKIK